MNVNNPRPFCKYNSNCSFQNLVIHDDFMGLYLNNKTEHYQYPNTVILLQEGSLEPDRAITAGQLSRNEPLFNVLIICPLGKY